jgi:sulfur carrier protein
MKLLLNGTEREIAASTLAEVLEAEGLGAAKVATAVNGTFVPAAARAATPLRVGDAVEIVAPMQGG